MRNKFPKILIAPILFAFSFSCDSAPSKEDCLQFLNELQAKDAVLDDLAGSQDFSELTKSTEVGARRAQFFLIAGNCVRGEYKKEFVECVMRGNPTKDCGPKY